MTSLSRTTTRAGGPAASSVGAPEGDDPRPVSCPMALKVGRKEPANAESQMRIEDQGARDDILMEEKSDVKRLFVGATKSSIESFSKV